jgi:hypothetical protein
VRSARPSRPFVEGAERGLWKFVENPQQRLQRGIGLAPSLPPFAQGRHGDVELLGELRLGEPELPADVAHTQQRGQRLGRRRQLRILCDHAIDVGIGQAFELRRLTPPPRRDGPLPLPPKGGEALVSRQEYSWLSVTALGAGREQAIPLGHSP